MALAIRNTSETQKELCVILRKKFAIKLAIDIQQYLMVKPIALGKIGVRFTKDLHLTEAQKNLLRESLRLVYGESVAIVSLPELQVVENTVRAINSSPQLPATKVTSSTPAKPVTGWQKVRKHLIEVYGDALVRVSFEKLDISETENQITFSGSNTFTEIIEGKFGANLDWLAGEYGLCFVFKGKSKAFAEPVISEIN